jgi:hypothetical protein
MWQRRPRDLIALLPGKFQGSSREAMTSSGFPAAEATGEREYARFGKRNLDRMSWLAPLVNNRLGDRLNLELRHEQLFFIRGDRVLEDIGYSEQGQRFTEAEFGKPIHSLEDLKRNGYWLVGQEYDPAVMREALAEQRDGYYYSLFSNQCQDWADRLRRSAERLEAQRGIKAKPAGHPSAPHYTKPVSPTEPASIWMGVLALILGTASILGPSSSAISSLSSSALSSWCQELRILLMACTLKTGEIFFTSCFLLSVSLLEASSF